MKLLRWLPRRTVVRCTSLLAPAFPLLLSGCGGLGEAMTAHTDIVARAAGNELKVEEAVQLLSANPQIPADPQVVRALADFWVDYTLLATAAAEDTLLSSLNLDAFIAPAKENLLITRLLTQSLQIDTTFTEQELQQRWVSEGPGAEVQARHILLRIPAEATPAQRDSVRQLAEQLRQQAAQGADFAALARQYSQDPGSAERGGDLGSFGRGRMVAPFEEAAFKLQPGEISPVVETPFGYHVIKVEGRQQPELGEQRADFRGYLVQRAAQEAETKYLDSIATAANVQIQPGGLAVVREIAGRPDTQLRGRAAERAISTYNRGAFTSGEFVEFIRTQSPQVQSMFASASDEQLESAVEQLTRKELLLQQARAKGISLSRAEEDSIRSEARQAIRQVLTATGLGQAGARGANAAAIDARVKELLRQVVAGQAQPVQLGGLGFLLRELYPSEINEGAFTQVVAALEKLRAGQPAAPGMPGTPGAGVPQPMPQPAPQPAPVPTPADTGR